MVGTAGVESNLAQWTSTITLQILGDAEGAFAVATINGFNLKFRRRPHDGGMVSQLFVAPNAGVKGLATLKFDGNEVAFGVVVGALGALVNTDAVAANGFDWGSGHWLGVKPFYLQHPAHPAQPLNEFGQVVGVVHKNHNLALENTVVTVDGNGAHVHFQAGTDDAGYVVD